MFKKRSSVTKMQIAHTQRSSRSSGRTRRARVLAIRELDDGRPDHAEKPSDLRGHRIRGPAERAGEHPPREL
jgi:hypothetical protein